MQQTKAPTPAIPVMLRLRPPIPMPIWTPNFTHKKNNQAKHNMPANNVIRCKTP